MKNNVILHDQKKSQNINKKIDRILSEYLIEAGHCVGKPIPIKSLSNKTHKWIIVVYPLTDRYCKKQNIYTYTKTSTFKHMI